ncbi:MAG: (2Fe-2S) ferredoxin domain-containing protein [Candidatus Magasanikbacteria bacterium]|nr:(2Fe-2S) ferredoxin domain-containing protein [Candidatus Magasanikbacteria bacterium]
MSNFILKWTFFYFWATLIPSMHPAKNQYRKLVCVCTNMRENGAEYCAMKGSVELHAALKLAVKAVAPDIRVAKSGCLNNCPDGPTVVIQPDNIWLGGVTEADIPALVELITKKDV